jgi:hypothetical protein
MGNNISSAGGENPYLAFTNTNSAHKSAPPPALVNPKTAEDPSAVPKGTINHNPDEFLSSAVNNTAFVAVAGNTKGKVNKDLEGWSELGATEESKEEAGVLSLLNIKGNAVSLKPLSSNSNNEVGLVKEGLFAALKRGGGEDVHYQSSLSSLLTMLENA